MMRAFGSPLTQDVSRVSSWAVWELLLYILRILTPLAAPTQATHPYLVPSANPIWSWRLGGGLDALGAPAILSDTGCTHYC